MTACRGGTSCSCPPRAGTLGGLAPERVAVLRQAVKPLSVSYEKLAPGARGLAQITPRMESLVVAALVDPHVRRAAELVTRDARPGDRMQEARAIFDWMYAHVKFLRDPSDTQLLISPVTLISRVEATSVAKTGAAYWPELPGGWAATNCAGHSMTTATLGHEIRLPIVWVLAGPTLADPEHIYAAMRLDGRDVGDPVDDVLKDLLSLDTGSPWDHVPAFGKHVNAPALRVVPALRGL